MAAVTPPHFKPLSMPMSAECEDRLDAKCTVSDRRKGIRASPGGSADPGDGWHFLAGGEP